MLELDKLQPHSDQYAAQVVDHLLRQAVASGASDVHVEKANGVVQLRWRVEGALQDLGVCPDGQTTSILGRIKALAGLVTYRHDIPQEGRMVLGEFQLEARVGTLPTLHGERAVIRLANRSADEWLPHQLGLQPDALERLLQGLASTSGVILITGPAGAGKTTTAYACLRHLQRQTHALRSLVTLEDPIERELSGVSQSQINPASGYDWSDGLKALLRQDSEVILVGEIRDPETAAVVFQAAMTGQLVLATMHARTASDALRRLLDMQVPSHHLRSALDLLICQRLRHALPVPANGEPPGDMRLSVEVLPMIEGCLAESIQSDASTQELQRAAVALGMQVFDA